MSSLAQHPSLPQQPPAVYRWWLVVLPLLFVGIRAAFAANMELSGDEAYYWTWSRAIAGGYFDHPPMVAWVIRLSTALFGQSELAIRLPAILLATGSVLASLWVLSFFTVSVAQLLTLELLLLSFPITHVTASVITPDTPALFFVTLALGAGIWCMRQPARRLPYLLLGLTGGLAMLSKYTALLPISAIFLVLALRDFRQIPRIFVAGLLSILVLSPLLLWNYQHDWISFRFQLSHGTGRDEREPLLNLAEYLGVNLLIAIPTLLPLMAIEAYRALRRGDAARRLLAVTGLITFLLFAFTATRHKVEGNWAILTYPPLLILIVLAYPTAGRHFRNLLRSGMIIGVCAVLVLSMPPALLTRLSPRSPVAKIGGWRPLANQIAVIAAGRPIICTKYQDAALLSFYLRGHPVIPILREPESRLTQDDVTPRPMPTGEFVLVTDNGDILPGSTQTLLAGPYRLRVLVSDMQNASITLDGFQTRFRLLFTCTPDTGDATPSLR